MTNHRGWEFTMAAIVFGCSAFLIDSTVNKHHSVLTSNTVVAKSTVKATPLATSSEKSEEQSATSEVEAHPIQPQPAQLPADLVLRPQTKDWLKRFPEPQNEGQRAFLLALGKVHEANEEWDSHELEDFSSLFLHQDEWFDKYLLTTLNKLETAREQKERNFIYQFGRQSRPENPWAELIAKDVKDIRQGNKAISQVDENNLIDLLMSQPDMTFESKHAILEDR